MRAAAARQESQQLVVARFGDNMREVAVTEGNKVGAQIQFGYSVTAYGLGDLASVVDEVSLGDIDALVEEYEASYILTDKIRHNGEKRQNLLDAARIELGMKRFLEQAGCKAFTTNFENLYGLKQLPGLAVQRLMQQGYGFAGEGDWKTAALLRILKVMAAGLPGGTSFMEDYTYNFQPENNLALGSHMLEVCPSIAKEEKPTLDVQFLGIGGKADPARLLFSHPGRPGGERIGYRYGRSLPYAGERGGYHRTTRTRCRSCRWPAPSGRPGLPWKWRPKPGSSAAARIIPYSARH